MQQNLSLSVARQGVTKRRRGLTMIETIIAIVVGLIILGGVGYLVTKAVSSNKSGNSVSQMQNIAKGVIQVYSNQGSYTGLNNTVAIGAGVVPAPMIASATAGTIVDPWGGAVTIAVAVPTTTFTVSYAGVPKDACVTLVAGQTSGSTGVTVNGTPLTPGNNGVYTVADANTNCTASSTVVFTYQ